MVNYKNYRVWQRSHKMVLTIYELTKSFPKSEQYGLVSQMNRAAVSVPTNIAEGCGRETQKELVRFLYVASGSSHELDYLVLLSKELGLVKEAKALDIINELDEIKKMLAALIQTIKTKL